MKIKITENCECCWQTKNMPDVENVALNKGAVLEGNVEICTNWNGIPLNAVDLITENVRYLGIPNNCWKELCRK
jgi:acetyltransferase-like isoleucine patch superfamily enzyme